MSATSLSKGLTDKRITRKHPQEIIRQAAVIITGKINDDNQKHENKRSTSIHIDVIKKKC